MADNENIEILTEFPDGNVGSGLDAYISTLKRKPEIQTQETEESADAESPTDTRAGRDQSDVGVDSDRLDKIEQRLQYAQQHIGVLEGENKGLREIVTQSPAFRGTPPTEEVEQGSPLDDPEVMEYYRRAYGDDDVAYQANRLMLKQIENHLDQRYSKQSAAVEQTQEDDRRMKFVQQNLFDGFQHAATTYGEPATRLIQQYISTSGRSGVLAQAIQSNQAAVSSPQSVSDTVARLVWHLGKMQAEKDKGETSPNPTSRPSRSHKSTNMYDELTPEQKAAKAIVASRGVKDSLKFMR